MLDLYKLRIFVTVVQEGSFSAAAERLYITQSAVSQHVSDLEAGLGVKLFTRGRRGVTLTHPGQILLGYARQIFDLVVEAENAVADVENLEGGALTIGATPGVGVYLLPDWISSFRARYPRLTISTQTGITSEIISGILAQRAFRLSPDVTAGAAFDALSALGADLLLESLPDYLAGKLTPVPQPEDGVTYAPMLKKEDGRLDFARPADELERRVRAMNPWLEYRGRETVQSPAGPLEADRYELFTSAEGIEPFESLWTLAGTCVFVRAQARGQFNTVYELVEYRAS